MLLMVSTFVVSVICQINFGKGLKKYCTPSNPRVIANGTVVERVRKEKEMGYVSYDLDENTEYKGIPPQGKGPRVLLD